MVNIIYFLRPLNKYNYLVLLFYEEKYFDICRFKFVLPYGCFRKKNVFTEIEEAWRRCEKFSVSKDGKLLLTTIS